MPTSSRDRSRARETRHGLKAGGYRGHGDKKHTVAEALDLPFHVNLVMLWRTADRKLLQRMGMVVRPGRER